MNTKSIAPWITIIVCLSLGACSAVGSLGDLGVNQDRDVTREGEVFDRLDQLREQLRLSGAMDPILQSNTESQLLASQTLLGLGDFYLLQGMEYFSAMQANQTDFENYERATNSLQLSVQYYQSLKEEWLQAQSMYMLALTNMRAGKPQKTCEFYDQTLSLLRNPRGQLREFEYNAEQFSNPQDYVKGVLGEACGIYRAQQAVAKNSR